MKKIIYLCAFLGLISLQTAWAQNTYEVKNFTGVGVSERINAEIKIGNTFAVELKGDQEAIDELTVELRNKVLVIRPKISWKSWQKSHPDAIITAEIEMPKIETLVASGLANINVEGKNTSNGLTLTLSGSGKINVLSDSKNVTVVMSGSGECKVTGSCEKLSATLSGSGKCDTKELVTKNLNALISGSGTVYTQASENISAKITGSGIVYYKGDPEIKSYVFIGTGSVKKMED